MRIAIVSDIHGNRTAFEAVLADLKHTSPDLTFHGGDLAHGGSGPGEIVDRIRELGWPGVLGNTDEMLFRPQSFTDFAARTPAVQPMAGVIEDVAAAARDELGSERLAWLAGLPMRQVRAPLALVHASPDSPWLAPAPDASDADMEKVYQPLNQPIAVYAHVHRSFVRSVGELTVINTGSVSLSYDGDRRAAYLLLDDSRPEIRRVAYDVEQEIKDLNAREFPHADWIARTLRSASPQRP
jgi:predicted phosphodiesterase